MIRKELEQYVKSLVTRLLLSSEIWVYLDYTICASVAFAGFRIDMSSWLKRKYSRKRVGSWRSIVCHVPGAGVS